MKKFNFNQYIYQFHRLNWHNVLINQTFSHIILIILYLVCVIILFGTRMNLLNFSGQIANLDDHAIYATPNNFQDLCDSFDLQPFDIYEASKNAILNVSNNRHEPEITYIP